MDPQFPHLVAALATGFPHVSQTRFCFFADFAQGNAMTKALPLLGAFGSDMSTSSFGWATGLNHFTPKRREKQVLLEFGLIYVKRALGTAKNRSLRKAPL
ncbi:MAG: hypothetical protein WC988_00770 [Patescibacteria group bacterium]